MNDIRALAAGVIAGGFDGYDVTPEIAAAIDDLKLGGWILFGRNTRTVEQARALTDAIRTHYPADLPPILAIDQEGGRVARLREGLEQIPAMMAVAATGDEGLARRAGEQMAFDLRRVGGLEHDHPAQALGAGVDQVGRVEQLSVDLGHLAGDGRGQVGVAPHRLHAGHGVARFQGLAAGGQGDLDHVAELLGGVGGETEPGDLALHLQPLMVVGETHGGMLRAAGVGERASDPYIRSGVSIPTSVSAVSS